MILLIFSLLSVNMIGITVAQVDHDIAVISVTPSSTSVRLGELVNVTVVVENQGMNNETFNMTVYYDTSAIETKTAQNLAIGANQSLIFTWNTTNTREGIYAETKKEKTYNVTATATITQDDDPDDNTLVREDAVKVISQYIAVIPQSTVDTTLTPGKNYTVSIYSDYNGTDIWGYQFALSYNPSVLEGIEVVNGDLITIDKHPDAMFGAGTFNNTLGKLSLPWAWINYEAPPAPTTYGPGILANVTFRVKGTGDSNITLIEDKTELRNPEKELAGIIINYFLPSRHHILHGYFRNTAGLVTHDIAVVSVTPSPTSVVIGEFVNITVVVENQGTVPETFDVEVYYVHPLIEGLQHIETETAQYLAVDANQSLTFTWNTTGVLTGNHTITAVASLLYVDDTDTTNNACESDEIVTVAELEETPLPVTELVIGVVVVVGVIAAVMYALKRRKKSTPE